MGEIFDLAKARAAKEQGKSPARAAKGDFLPAGHTEIRETEDPLVNIGRAFQELGLRTGDPLLAGSGADIVRRFAPGQKADVVIQNTELKHQLTEKEKKRGSKSKEPTTREIPPNSPK